MNHDFEPKSQPIIDPESIPGLTADERDLVERIITRKSGTPTLRASKPKVDRSVPYTGFGGRPCLGPTEETGQAAYLWRMVAFQISPIPAHHCLPVTAEFDLPVRGDNYQERLALAKELDALADRITASIPLSQHHGTLRWYKVMYG